MNKRVTLKDVAARAGVSYQTVSKVLNGQAAVASETAEQIWRVVNELGYRPNSAARNLRKSASYLIGYSWTPMPPDRANPILDRFLSSTVEAAEAMGYHLLLFPSHNQTDQTESYRKLVRSGQVDGFILTTTNYDDPRIRLLQSINYPFVAFGRANPDWHFPFVDVDGRAGLRAATQHLLAQGHRRIALLAWPEHSRTGAARTNGYIEAMTQAGITPDPVWITRGEGSAETGAAMTRQLLQLPPERRPTAVVAVEDQLAIGAMQAARQHSLPIGQEFGVVGFDDAPGIQHLTPSLSSVRQPIWEVGQLIVGMLIDILMNRAFEQEQIVLAPRLIVRESSLRRTSD